MATPPPPPGWYPDQYGTQRWWDGRQWTEHVAPAAPQYSAPVAPSGPRVALSRWDALCWWIGASALGMVVGGFGPWIVSREFSVLSVSGTQRDGPFIIVGGFAVIGLLVAALRSGSRLNASLPLIPAAICAVIAAIDLADVLRRDLIRPGWGLYLCLGASVAAAGGALVLLVRSPRR